MNKDTSKQPSCEMEKISWPGLCGRPATHIWTHRDGKTLVCNRCIFSVIVNGGDLEKIPELKESNPGE